LVTFNSRIATEAPGQDDPKNEYALSGWGFLSRLLAAIAARGR
jgi:hypothetical protein